jgi:hypothetical protein
MRQEEWMSDVARKTGASAGAHRSPRPSRRRVLVCLGVLIALALMTAAASAYWSGSGSGTGSATADSTVAVTLSPGVPAAGLYPGGLTDVVLAVANPNTAPVSIGSLALDPTQGTGGFAVDAGHAGCLVAALSYTVQSNGGAGWTVPAKAGATNGSLSIRLSNALAMSTAAADACQGASATVYLAAGS